ncbi:MAG: zinc transport system ATP-binding protein [Lentisphaeria bacterium]|jgi:zinc transport system ATP-binding protein
METKLVSLDKVGFVANGKTILKNISFDIERRQITTVIGPNGAGKSTLVKILVGLLNANSGSISSQRNICIGYVPQKLSMDISLPMKVSRFLSLANVKKQAYVDALQLFSINHLRDQQMHKLSGGEMQRVLLARAVARNPDLLVLDEPLQGVDVTGQIELYRLIASLRDSLDCAILMISHDLHLVMAQTDSVICLNQHMCCHGQPESVSQHPEYLKLFGKHAADIAVYTHDHDHHHDIHGDAVTCKSGCDHA